MTVKESRSRREGARKKGKGVIGHWVELGMIHAGAAISFS